MQRRDERVRRHRAWALRERASRAGGVQRGRQLDLQLAPSARGIAGPRRCRQYRHPRSLHDQRGSQIHWRVRLPTGRPDRVDPVVEDTVLPDRPAGADLRLLQYPGLHQRPDVRNRRKRQSAVSGDLDPPLGHWGAGCNGEFSDAANRPHVEDDERLAGAAGWHVLLSYHCGQFAVWRDFGVDGSVDHDDEDLGNRPELEHPHQ